jgi:hypothetical protein
MNFTQSSHFVGLINLPNTASSYPYEGANLVLDTTTYESIYLSKIFGYKMAKDLIAAMLVVTPPTSGIWFDLANGKEFTDSNGDLNKWLGFKTIGFNPIANYVYDQIVRNNVTHMTGLGTQKPNIANNTAASPRAKLTTAWNQMVEFNWTLHEFIEANKASYPNYLGITDANRDLYNYITF